MFEKELVMAIAERTASTTWEGSLARGAGAIKPGSGAFEALPVTWAARTEAPGGKTSPEELAAAAHSSCFAMALSLCLGERKAPPERLDVSATVTLDEVDGKPTVVSSALTVRGQVPGLDASGFQEAVNEAAALCPISRLFAGARISVDAELESA
jgi:osmotically inducible protein OsmC